MTGGAAGGKVGVVLVNWNGWRDSLDCITSLDRSRYRDILPILVDNASSDESVEMFKTLPDTVDVVYSNVNGGWSGGNNLGIARAIERGCDYIYLLNNDAAIDPAAIEVLVARASDPRHAEYGILGSIVDSDPPGDHYECSGTTVEDYSLLPFAMGHAKGDPALDVELLPVAFVPGCSIFFHRSVIDRIGAIDDRFYLNYDETDFCYRARAHGISSALCPASLIFHKGSATIGGAKSPLNLYFLTRNQLLFAEKHFDFRHWARLVAVAWEDIRRRKRAIAAASASERPQLELQIEAVKRGLFDYVRRRFGNCPDRIREINRLSRKTASPS